MFLTPGPSLLGPWRIWPGSQDTSCPQTKLSANMGQAFVQQYVTEVLSMGKAKKCCGMNKKQDQCDKSTRFVYGVRGPLCHIHV